MRNYYWFLFIAAPLLGVFYRMLGASLDAVIPFTVAQLIIAAIGVHERAVTGGDDG